MNNRGRSICSQSVRDVHMSYYSMTPPLGESQTVFQTAPDFDPDSQSDSYNVQGVSTQTFIFHFALAGRNMQASFGLKVVWES